MLKADTKFANLNEYQAQVVNLVEKYKQLFRQEYDMVCSYLKDRRKELKTEFAEIEAPKHGNRRNDAIERGLYEIPQTLSVMLDKHLTMQASMWLRTKEGGRWFVKKYKEFLSGDKS